MQKVQPSKSPVRFGVFELDAHSGELRKQGVRIKLQDQPLQLLQVLLERAGEVVTREELQQCIWPADTFVDFDKGIYNAVKKLREALGDDAGSPRYIETLPKRGYRFIAPLVAPLNGNSWETEAPASPNLPQLEASRPAVLHAIPRFVTWKILGVAALLILLLALGARYWQIRTTRKLTDKDTIVLADFTNNTGETVFDDALKEGLTVDLKQSTFLNILSDERIKDQLKYMGRSNDERLVPDLAREVCQREGSKAALFGSISNLGTHYVLTLKAVACQNSELLDEEQGEIDKREKVLTQLHELASRLRKRLGESFDSIKKNDTPLEQATTPSLEALEAYSVATRTFRSKGEMTALPLFKRATELDPNFAQAYADLSVIYATLNEYELSIECAKKAYDRREKVSQWERFSIDSTYYQAMGDLEKEIQVLETWKQTYPRWTAPYINLGLVDSYLGRLDKALEDDLQALRLNPNTARVYSNVAADYMSLDRLDEAEAILKEAQKRNLDEIMVADYYELAFLRGDEDEMSRRLAEAVGKPGTEDALLASQSDTEAFHGRLARARAYSQRAVDSAIRADAKETAAAWQADQALREAEFGNSAEAVKEVNSALSLASTKEVKIAAGLALARAGEIRRAQTIASELEKHFPQDTLLNSYWLPNLRGAIALRRNQANQAIECLQGTAPYELGGATPPFSSGATLYSSYLRGEAFLADHQWHQAIVQFQEIRAHRGLVWNFPLGALAILQLGRAYAGSGDADKARAAYADFLSLWHDSDPNIPILQAAKAEYSSLSQLH